jgi:hypothetical protein
VHCAEHLVSSFIVMCCRDTYYVDYALRRTRTAREFHSSRVHVTLSHSPQQLLLEHPPPFFSLTTAHCLWAMPSSYAFGLRLRPCWVAHSQFWDSCRWHTVPLRPVGCGVVQSLPLLAAIILARLEPGTFGVDGPVPVDKVSTAVVSIPNARVVPIHDSVQRRCLLIHKGRRCLRVVWVQAEAGDSV